MTPCSLCVRRGDDLRGTGRFDRRAAAHRRSAEEGFSLPNSRILIHQPWMSGLSGQATDIDIHAKEILRMRTVINGLLAQHSGQSVEKIEKDVERDFIMSSAKPRIMD